MDKALNALIADRAITAAEKAEIDDGRLTKRGVEICYRLFDMGKSTMAVAHLADLSLIAARKRQRMWKALGGVDRVKAAIATIPHRKFYARHEE